MKKEQRLLDVKEISLLLGWSPYRVEKWLEEKTEITVLNDGGTKKIDPVQFHRFLNGAL